MIDQPTSHHTDMMDHRDQGSCTSKNIRLKTYIFQPNLKNVVVPSRRRLRLQFLIDSDRSENLRCVSRNSDGGGLRLLFSPLPTFFSLPTPLSLPLFFSFALFPIQPPLPTTTSRAITVWLWLLPEAHIYTLDVALSYDVTCFWVFKVCFTSMFEYWVTVCINIWI